MPDIPVPSPHRRWQLSNSGAASVCGLARASAIEWRSHLEYATLFAAMADRADFVVLKYVNKTPSLASCVKCRRKFFTPNSYYSDPVGAEEYLRTKFDRHNCFEDQRKMERAAEGRLW